MDKVNPYEKPQERKLLPPWIIPAIHFTLCLLFIIASIYGSSWVYEHYMQSDHWTVFPTGLTLTVGFMLEAIWFYVTIIYLVTCLMNMHKS